MTDNQHGLGNILNRTLIRRMVPHTSLVACTHQLIDGVDVTDMTVSLSLIYKVGEICTSLYISTY